MSSMNSFYDTDIIDIICINMAFWTWMISSTIYRRQWLNDAAYAELLALCQFVPGPSSSQLGFAVARHRRGLAGACAAWLVVLVSGITGYLF